VTEHRTTDVGIDAAVRGADPEAEGAAIRDAVRATIDDYFLGWYDGDPDRMARALHPDLAKRSHLARAYGQRTLDMTSAAQMIDATTRARGRRLEPADRWYEVTIDEIHDTIAAARVHAVPYIEYIHLVLTPAGWRIVNTLWQEP
jgi:hypothetical protein